MKHEGVLVRTGVGFRAVLVSKLVDLDVRPECDEAKQRAGRGRGEQLESLRKGMGWRELSASVVNAAWGEVQSVLNKLRASGAPARESP